MNFFLKDNSYSYAPSFSRDIFDMLDQVSGRMKSQEISCETTRLQKLQILAFFFELIRNEIFVRKLVLWKNES